MLMKIIVRGPQSGKTDELIRISAEQPGYALLVVETRNRASAVFRRALGLGHDIPQPITFCEFLDGNFFAPGVAAFLIDDADVLLRDIVKGVPVAGMSLTGDAELTAFGPSGTIVVRRRHGGKTEALVRLAASDGRSRLLVGTVAEAQSVAIRARKYHMFIAPPLVLGQPLVEKTRGASGGRGGLLIDNADMLLQRAAVGVPIAAITMTGVADER